MKQLIFTLFVCILISSCNTKDKSVSEQGVITYNITYPREIANQGFASFLPDKMKASYKGDHFKYNLSGEFNMYKLEYISRANGDTCYTLFKVFDKKLYYPHDHNEKAFLLGEDMNPEITFYSDSTKVIAGIKCKKAVATFVNDDIPNMTLYYSEEITFNNPNAGTPFNEIPGALLEFNFFFKGLTLNLMAESVNMQQVNTDEFIVPSNYRRTNANEINDIVSSLLEL